MEHRQSQSRATPGAGGGGEVGTITQVHLRRPLAPSPRTFQCICSQREGPGGQGSAGPAPSPARAPLHTRHPEAGQACGSPAGGHRNKCSLKMADSRPRQLQPAARAAAAEADGRLSEVPGSCSQDREGREAGLQSPPLPPASRFYNTRSLAALPRHCHPRERKYLGICCPAPAAPTRSSACRGAATPRTPGSLVRSR